MYGMSHLSRSTNLLYFEISTMYECGWWHLPMHGVFRHPNTMSDWTVYAMCKRFFPMCWVSSTCNGLFLHQSISDVFCSQWRCDDAMYSLPRNCLKDMSFRTILTMFFANKPRHTSCLFMLSNMLRYNTNVYGRFISQMYE